MILINALLINSILIIFSQNGICKIVFIVVQNNFCNTELNSLMNYAPSTDQIQELLQLMRFCFFNHQTIPVQG